jgi:hypothetical protein
MVGREGLDRKGVSSCVVDAVKCCGGVERV